MKRANRIAIGAACVALLLISWIVAIGSKSPVEKQLDLMQRAAEMTNDGIYILAVPLLEEAAGYSTIYTPQAESELKKVYLALIDSAGFRQKYTSLLEKQMNRRDAHPGYFAEAADYYLSVSRVADALAALREGIGRTGSEALVEQYEENRYAYQLNSTSYEYVAAIHGGAVQVMREGLWGVAKSDGSLMIPCEYSRVSTFYSDRAIVMQNEEIFAVDRNNNRIALLRAYAEAFGNFAEDRVPLLINGRWTRATGEFILGAAAFEDIGTYSGGYAAAKENGLWGVVDLASGWLVPAEYDEIIMDELGRCYAQGAVFTRKGDSVHMRIGNAQVGESYEDARPFSEEGFAAVKKNGKWGFIDAGGNMRIDFIFDDALSFGQHLAAVKIDELWGYISLSGDVVIEPVFLEAKSFSNGNAPVFTARGWQFITLLEYKRGAGLAL